MNVGAQLRSVERGMEIVASYPEWRNTPIILGESDPEGCAACKGEQNGYRNGPLYGVSVAEAMMRTYELARKENVHLQGAVTWAFEFEGQPYFAGFRQLATNGIDMAVLNVFRMFGMLGGDWVQAASSGALALDDVVANSVTSAPDVNAVATRRPHEVDVLVWNYHDDDEVTAPAGVELSVRNLPGKAVQMQLFRMDDGHSNAFAAWKAMGSPQPPSAEQVRQLQERAGLESALPVRLPVQAGVANLEFSLPRQGVYLAKLSW
jgi:xylan 1,4-beta-xylosidase